MKNILSFLFIALFLNGCRFIDTREKYVDEKSAPPLTIPEGLDKPNSTSKLEIPDIQDKTDVTESSRIPPPDMPIRKKQSDDGLKRIDVLNGSPVLVAQVSKDKMWNAMNNLNLENWKITESDKNNCIVGLKYTDVDAEERKNANIIKRIFTRDGYYTDFSNFFLLECKESGKVMETTFKQKDGQRAKSFLVDAVMDNLYNQI